MDTNLGDKTDAGNHAAIPGPSISDLTDVALLDNADFGLVLDHNTLDPNGFDMNFDELWSNDFNQSPGDANITQNHLQQLNTFDSSSNQSPIPTPSTLPPKVGHRFTLEALRSLKEWLSAHTDNPYPTEEEKTILEHQTGLSRTQITNWLANARRRRTITDGRASGNTQVPEGYTPTRSGTPIPRRGQPLRDLNPLQRWENSPPENEPATASDIARAMESGELIRSICLFCGQDNPDENHLANHNPSACQERAFSRKDHLKQHLRLVHNAALTDLTTKLWKTAQPDITSRCGFCQASLSTWPDRVDHLANHFKLGCTMRSWIGDWGFSASVLKTLENAMPPYLVYFEGGTPFPFTANGSPPDCPRSAYELISIELAYFIQNHNDTTGSLPSHRALQLEACRIVFGSEVMFPETDPDLHGGSSWLRDLIVSSDEIVQQARFAPIRSRAESRLSALRIKGRNALFEECPLESRLQAFVRTQRAKGIHAVSDEELQREAGRIMLQMESELQAKPEYVANWLIGFLNHSTGWIGVFRQRAELVLVSDSQNAVELNNISQWQDGAQWQVGGSAWLTGNDWLLVGHGDAAGDNTPWGTGIENSTDHTSTDASLRDFTWLWSDDQSPPAIPQSNPSPEAESQSTLRPTWLGPGIYVLNDPNHIPWFAREMKRWVKAAMSPNNPISHVPSDEELRHQARCLLYNDDDPWNQTAADNAQWLEMFKKDVGIL
ncbi:hypothetical protein FPSE_04442 [Fusarium pseudograminearum CS3096]|uniref:Homeobox domain-containing protein n=1 Tax=Fusarium pseudograminearum (strain CS3096) TaxID=1028729 RepID=K3USH5_FUSPC|nr:hypothetical protein FPSE_04442 [Fusarium pseudograminearum CS3096]EKJ75361.1 hypothetical protein FPSE_04442 [Fusarium pseudograminearum CS3096]